MGVWEQMPSRRSQGKSTSKPRRGRDRGGTARKKCTSKTCQSCLYSPRTPIPFVIFCSIAPHSPYSAGYFGVSTHGEVPRALRRPNALVAPAVPCTALVTPFHTLSPSLTHSPLLAVAHHGRNADFTRNWRAQTASHERYEFKTAPFRFPMPFVLTYCAFS